MIPNILPFDHRHAGSRQELSAFSRGPKERPLKVWLDVDSLNGDEKGQRVLGFKEHPQIDMRAVQLNQITLREEGDSILEEITANSVRTSSFRPARHNLDVLKEWGVALDQTVDADVEKRIVLAMFARGDCDALVTRSKQVLGIAPIHYPESNAMLPAAALSAIGLFLRLRGDFVYEQFDKFRVETSSLSFYSVLAGSVLPELFRWKALSPSNDSPLDPSPAGLVEAIHIRTTRMLRARDRLHGQLLRSPSRESIDEALLFFDSFLTAFAGIFDCIARVADRLYGIDQPHRASWRRDDWLRRVEQSDPATASLVACGSYSRHVCELLFILRNTIHEQVLVPIGVLNYAERLSRFDVAVPKREHARFWAAAEALGGHDVWGITKYEPDIVSINLAAFTERILAKGLAALNQLLASIPVESFGVQGSPPYAAPEDEMLVAAHMRELAGIE